jgi:hypothetical protein
MVGAGGVVSERGRGVKIDLGMQRTTVEPFIESQEESQDGDSLYESRTESQGKWNY